MQILVGGLCSSSSSSLMMMAMVETPSDQCSVLTRHDTFVSWLDLVGLVVGQLLLMEIDLEAIV